MPQDNGHVDVAPVSAAMAIGANGTIDQWGTREVLAETILAAGSDGYRDSDGDGLRSKLVHGVIAAVRGDQRDGDLPDAALASFGAAHDDIRTALAFLFALRDAVVRRADEAGGMPTRQSIDVVVDHAAAVIVAARVDTLHRQALTDELTGLGNRRAFDRDLRIEIARAERSGLPLTLVIVDVDGLKTINDCRGHNAGDDALRSAATALNDMVRKSDRAYRHGGDEFALILPDAVVADPQTLVERLRRLGAPACSVGIACSSDDSPDALFAVADQRMYARRDVERSQGTFLGANALHRILL